MDDFNIASLTECRNEYTSLLISKITPLVVQGINSIFKEAYQLCVENEEEDKYLMTFQNFLMRIHKWNNEIVEKETNRIIQDSKCSFLEELLTCVHITQMKILTTMRVSSKQKKIDIDIPSLSIFIHNVYTIVSRKVYKNVYLYEQSVMPLTKQKNMREVEQLVKESIMEAVRNSIPVEQILRSYMEVSMEEDKYEVKEEIVEEVVPDDTPIQPETTAVVPEQQQATPPATPPVTPVIPQTQGISPVPSVESFSQNMQLPQEGGNLSFNNVDNVKYYNSEEVSNAVSETPTVSEDAPKNIERLEQISEMRREEERSMYEDEDEDEDKPLQILDDVTLGDLDIITDLDKKTAKEEVAAEVIKVDTAPVIDFEEL